MNPQTQEKNKLFEDVYDGKIPKRAPIMVNVDNAFALEYAGMDLRTDQFSVEKNLEAIDITSRDFDSDVVMGLMFRLPSLYKILEARNFIMGGDGFIQHPNVHGLEIDEYDELIADAYKTIWEKVLPRQYPALAKDKFEASKALTKAFFHFFATMGSMGQGYAGIAEKYGKSTYSIASGAATVPFDTLADQLRSFTGISSDIRRVPDKVIAACEALLPLAIKTGLGQNSSKYNRTFIPLHMGPYMREKDFAKFYWPTFKAFVDALDESNVGSNIFVEQDYTRFLDYLGELPAGQLLLFEYGDPKDIKKRLGDKHIISGLYPLSKLRNGTKQECVDYAKELIDILAPGGNFIFSFDKSIIRLNDVNPENMKAVCTYVKENAVY
ncbi:uroporphyrinogen decarboxylase [Alkalibacter rhizosphaerae]|uniref:Uroporphyrinogen decarboxylase n=1 Tax=Alkalibacter rhizosphaerae TaxID=2815577 RepID=A0A974XF85_9FIRM|nr:uroporphyrinogen decarboxylase family protein [Alkalibacter rhizosphaerae]QSX07635.1 uroporphyrinogen decarboxylase [Alkalibacter rhizosphaerae]